MSHDLSGRTLGHYQVLEPLGAGGMADVYRGHDAKHRRAVAIKVLREDATSGLEVERFQEEIQITANLQHPHILQLYDSGEIDGRLYYVMPLVEGESLRERLRRGPLPLAEALEVTRQIGAALQYAHDRDVVHRDIKPENVMLSSGQALVADFGIALALADVERTRLTAAGVSIGSPAYMSPEQAAGEQDIDARTDVYALGAILYEMLTGAPPFPGQDVRSVLGRVISEVPRPVSAINPGVPSAVSSLVALAMAKERLHRPASVAELVARLDAAAAPVGGLLYSRRARAVVGLAAILAVGVGIVLALDWRAWQRDRDWVRLEALPEVRRLLEESLIIQAFDLALEAREILPDDPTLAGYLAAASVEIAIESEPAGARVTYRPYGGGDWVELGVTPLEAARLPLREVVVRLQADGAPEHRRAWLAIPGVPLRVRLDAGGDDRVWVDAGSYSLGSERVAVPAFAIDRHEVTNAEYQAFVDAGSYADRETWAVFAESHGIDVSPDRAVAEFLDATGRPGPAGWELSRHRDDRSQHPVHGVSWFEAAAYCRWVGGALPSYYHWKIAAGIELRDEVLAASNLAGNSAGSTVPVGSTESWGVNGTLDMAGNVREWVWNASRQGRYILGGAWDAPGHVYAVYEAIDPWNRAPTNGFRCARYETEPTAELVDPIEEPYFDFNTFTPVDDATFSVFARLYDYEPTALDAERIVVETTEDWVRERVEIDAAYPGERVPMHVFLPTNVEPPYQTVIYMPGSAGFQLESSDTPWEQSQLMFLLRSGRALVYPVLKTMYERRLGPDTPRNATYRRQSTIWMTQDIMRVVDYAFERPELDEDRLAYMGLSFGAELAVPVALEKRLRALVLIGAALDPAWRGIQPEEAAPWNFVFRITTPTILINGDADAMHPYAEGQVPFFEAIDVPEADKRFVVAAGGHLPPWNDVIRHTLDWLDERLGTVPIERGSSAR